MITNSQQYLKIRTKLSLFFICCSITHHVIILVSPSQATVEVLQVLFFSCILYLLKTEPECLHQDLSSERTEIQKLVLVKSEGWYPCASLTNITLSGRNKKLIEGINNISMLHKDTEYLFNSCFYFSFSHYPFPLSIYSITT